MPAGARDYENAIAFVTFMRDPENAAIQSSFAGYANGTVGIAAFRPEGLRSAAEIAAPADVRAVFTRTRSERASWLADRVWTKLPR